MKPGRWQWRAEALADEFQSVTAGLRGLWPLWEAGALGVQDLVGTNPGTLVQGGGFPTLTGTPRGLGMRNTSAAGGYISLANPATLETQAVTVLAVVKPESAFTTNHAFSRGTDWMLSGDNTAGKMRFNISGGTSSASYQTTIGQVHAFIGRYDRKTVDLYADGIFVGSNAQTGAITTAGTMRIGGYSGGGLNWPGDVIMTAWWPDVVLAPDACKMLTRDPFGLIRPARRRWKRSIIMGGTALAGINEADLVAGGKVITLTTVGPVTWIP